MTATRVLIVDDNALNVELAAFVLDQGGFQVTSAADAVEAMAKIPDFQPDLILMDIQMPGMNGLELTHRLKSAADTRHITIVAFTGYAMKGDEAKMREAGCDGYLSKPIDVATFADSVRAFLKSPNTK
jgi:two-component system cell cycle response regulator DivK